MVKKPETLKRAKSPVFDFPEGVKGSGHASLQKTIVGEINHLACKRPVNAVFIGGIGA